MVSCVFCLMRYVLVLMLIMFCKRIVFCLFLMLFLVISFLVFMFVIVLDRIMSLLLVLLRRILLIFLVRVWMRLWLILILRLILLNLVRVSLVLKIGKNGLGILCWSILRVWFIRWSIKRLVRMSLFRRVFWRLLVRMSMFFVLWIFLCMICMVRLWWKMGCFIFRLSWIFLVLILIMLFRSLLISFERKRCLVEVVYGYIVLDLWCVDR